MSIQPWAPRAPLRATLNPPGEYPDRRVPPLGRAISDAPTGTGRRRLGTTGNSGLVDGVVPLRLFDRPTSVLVYGPSRDLVNLAVFALAEATTPTFQWLDIRVPGETRLALDPVVLGWVAADRLWAVESPGSLQPNDLGATSALFALIRSDEPPATVTQITEFLRLPETSQRILAVPPGDRRPGVVAVPNAHRVMASFSASQVPGILRAHRNSGFSVYAGYAEAAGTGRSAFDFVFRLEGEGASAWRTTACVCEQGIRTGPLADGRPVPLGQIPLFARVVERAASSAGPGERAD